MIIGLTGGIGSGKSTLVEMLRGKGVLCVDADEVLEEFYRPEHIVFETLVSEFGHGILTDGSVDRDKLRRLNLGEKVNEFIRHSIWDALSRQRRIPRIQ